MAASAVAIMKLLREAFLGPSYFHHRRLIQMSKKWTPSFMLDYQAAQVDRLTRRYGNEITLKEDYRRDLRRFTSWDVPLLMRTVRTGGTSGQPLRFRADTFARRQKERAYLFDVWSSVEYAPFDLRVIYRGNVKDELLTFNGLENAWTVSPSATEEGQLARLRSWLLRLPPFFLHVYPSSLYTFIDLVGDDLFRQLPVRGVLAGSEAFPPGEQLRFEERFGIRVAHWYGHSEYAVLARYCRECCGFHFYPTYGCVELAPSDVEGCLRIVASSFNRLGTHFVRYDTGDLAIAAAGHCSADDFPRVGSIVGRAQETFTDRSDRRRALGPYVFGIHGPFWDGVRDLQLVQDRPGQLRVRIVTTPAADRDGIQQVLARRLPMVALQFEYPERIDRNPSGKRKYFDTTWHAVGERGTGDALISSSSAAAPTTLPASPPSGR